jgi:hypothetical protein
MGTPSVRGAVLRSSRTWRLASGIVLLSYLCSHLATHMLGLVSLAAAEAGLRRTMAVWQSAPGTLALAGAFAIHLALALRTLATRRHWRLPPIEWLRLWAGFSLPWLLVGHVVSTRLANVLHGFEPSYAKVVSGLVAAGLEGWQIALLAPGWVHGCLGLWVGLRRWPPALRARWVLLAFLVAVPLLAAAGFLSMARELASGPLEPRVPIDPARAAALLAWRDGLQYGYLSLVAGAILIGLGRLAAARDRTPG